MAQRGLYVCVQFIWTWAVIEESGRLPIAEDRAVSLSWIAVGVNLERMQI